MTSSGVLVQNVLTGHRIDDLLSLHESFRSGGLVASHNQFTHGLDGGAVLRVEQKGAGCAQQLDGRAYELVWY